MIYERFRPSFVVIFVEKLPPGSCTLGSAFPHPGELAPCTTLLPESRIIALVKIDLKSILKSSVDNEMPDKPAKELYIYCMLLSQAYCRLTGEAEMLNGKGDGPLHWNRKVLSKNKAHTKISVSMGYSKA